VQGPVTDLEQQPLFWSNRAAFGGRHRKEDVIEHLCACNEAAMSNALQLDVAQFTQIRNLFKYPAACWCFLDCISTRSSKSVP
jgi:hypothetical protein